MCWRSFRLGGLQDLELFGRQMSLDSLLTMGGDRRAGALRKLEEVVGIGVPEIFDPSRAAAFARRGGLLSGGRFRRNLVGQRMQPVGTGNPQAALFLSRQKPLLEQ